MSIKNPHQKISYRTQTFEQ